MSINSQDKNIEKCATLLNTELCCNSAESFEAAELLCHLKQHQGFSLLINKGQGWASCRNKNHDSMHCATTNSCCPSAAGNFKAAELIAYLGKQAGDPSAADSAAEEEEAGTSSNKGKKEKEEKEVMQVVRELNMTDYEALSEEEDAWLVAFYAGNAQCGGVVDSSHCTWITLFSRVHWSVKT